MRGAVRGVMRGAVRGAPRGAEREAAAGCGAVRPVEMNPVGWSRRLGRNVSLIILSVAKKLLRAVQ